MSDKENDSKNDYFGNQNRLKEDKILFYLGLLMVLIGTPLIFSSINWIIIGIVLFFIGLMCLLAGFLGKKEELDKAGKKRISTSFGKISLLFGVISVFVSNGPYLALILGVIAIIFSVKSIRQGDNEYGQAGGIAGGIGIVVNLYVSVLFTIL